MEEIYKKTGKPYKTREEREQEALQSRDTTSIVMLIDGKQYKTDLPSGRMENYNFNTETETWIPKE